MKPGTIYIGHLPRGFYDEQLRGYFSQFGTVLKVRLARSKKTGGYKGYGYIQFASDEVAKIAADAMNNYLMFDRLLQYPAQIKIKGDSCSGASLIRLLGHYIPEEKLHPAIWKGANKKFVWLNPRKKHISLHNKVKSKSELKKSIEKLKKKDIRKRKHLLALGIHYDFPGYDAVAKGLSKSKKVSNFERTSTSKKVSKSDEIPTSQKVSKSDQIPTSQKVSKSDQIPTSQKVSKSNQIPTSQKVSKFKMTPTGMRVSRSQQNSTAKKVSKSKLTPKATDTKKKLKSPKLKKKMNSKSLS